MELTLPPQLDTGTALRYLGAAGWTPDDGTARLLAGAESALRAPAPPRGGGRRGAVGALVQHVVAHIEALFADVHARADD